MSGLGTNAQVPPVQYSISGPRCLASSLTPTDSGEPTSYRISSLHRHWAAFLVLFQADRSLVGGRLRSIRIRYRFEPNSSAEERSQGCRLCVREIRDCTLRGKVEGTSNCVVGGELPVGLVRAKWKHRKGVCRYWVVGALAGCMVAGFCLAGAASHAGRLGSRFARWVVLERTKKTPRQKRGRSENCSAAEREGILVNGYQPGIDTRTCVRERDGSKTREVKSVNGGCRTKSANQWV
ncbi:hypothetical protein PM082_023197 [Marasmius tenuissimus]|nr:hypothetical protein PM082_023197 [Marasmius tenuissimus]